MTYKIFNANSTGAFKSNFINNFSLKPFSLLILLFFGFSLGSSFSSLANQESKVPASTEPANKTFLEKLDQLERLVPDWLHVELYTNIELSSDPKQKTNVGRSHLSIIGGVDIEFIIKQAFEKSGYNFDHLRNASGNYMFIFRFSSIPSGIKNEVDSQLTAILNSELQTKREEAIEQLRAYLSTLRTQLIQSSFTKIDENLRNLVLKGSITQEQADQLAQEYKNVALSQIDHQISSIFDSKTLQIDNKIANAKAEHKQMINERLDIMSRRTTFQEVSFSYFDQFAFANAYYHLKIGMFGVPDNNDKEKGIFRTQVNTALSTVATTNFNFNLYAQTNNSIKIAIQGYLFHNTPAYYKASEFVANGVTLSKKDFEKYYQSYRIDSAVLKMLFQKNEEDSYFMVGSYDGNPGIGAGGDWILFKYEKTSESKEPVRFQWNIVKRSEVMSFGADAFVSTHPFVNLPNLGIFLGAIYQDNIVAPLHSHRSNRRIDMDEGVLGARYDLVDNKSILSNKLHYAIVISGGVRKIVSIDTGDKEEDKKLLGKVTEFINLEVQVNY